LPIDRCIEVGHALASALAHLHGHKLVHRDVKPSNVIFVGGLPKLADIGLVAGVDESRSFVGTEGYIPPEGPGTPSADCYALGKLLYELSTGHDRTSWPEPPADLATRPDREHLLELNAILHKACAPDPRERYESAGKMYDELTLFQAGRSIQQKRRVESRVALAKKFSIAAATFALVVTGAWLLSGNLSWRPPATRNAAGSATVDPLAGRLIAIKPFSNADGKPENDSLKSELDSQFRETFVDITGSKLVLTNSRAITNSAEDAREIGQRLKVRTVLEGSVTRVDNHGLAMVRLLRTSDGRELYVGSHEFEIYNRDRGLRPLIKSVTEALLADRSIIGSDQLAARCRRRWEALDNLLEGRYLASTGTKKGFDESIAYFNRAVTLDPNCAPAHSTLAWAWREAAGWHQPPVVALSYSRKHALDALEIDDSSHFARISLAYAKWYGDWDWAGAEAEFQRAVALAPQSGGAHSRYAVFLSAQGRSAEALDEHAKALQLSPNAYDVICVFASYLRLEGDYSRAIELCQGVLRADTSNIVALTVMARAYEAQSETDKAIAVLSRAREVDDAPDLIGQLGHCLAAKGERDKAKALLDELTKLSSQRHVSATFKAQVHVGLGQTNEAIACLQKACDEHAPTVTTLKIEPYWAPLRVDPRFRALLKKVGLEK
jgi:tetratricopeptide (TPR) repeat protein